MYSNRHHHKYIVFEKTVRFGRAIDENETPDKGMILWENEEVKINWNIVANISFGTEMKFKMERTIKYTNIPGPTKVSMKVIGYPHHQFSILANYPVVFS